MPRTYINQQIRRSIASLMTLFRALDADIHRFQKASGIRCATGCGRCCENPNIETTVLEVLPLAYDLWKTHKAEAALEKISQSPAPGRCLFYQTDQRFPGNGRCTVYPFRPLICRLFGFSLKTQKYGCGQIMTCPTIKTLFPVKYEKAVTLVQQGYKAPNAGDYGRRVYHIAPTLGQRQLPINEAVKIAIEKIGIFSDNAIRSDVKSS